jgi:aspartate beta-hydroxylase
VIRDEALSVLREDSGLEDFVQVRAGDRMENYLGGIAPAWEAFFFYRHGERYDGNHRRCPRTSAVLESLDLCRIPGQTPEICFSVLAAGTHILPHYGVSNARAVMHLPLVVPPRCALNLVERGQHEWREGELLLFDDTYLHEAWNRSTSPRVILLMDCWNPHLSAVEREFVCLLSEVIGVLDVALSPKVWPDADEPRRA